MLSPNEYIIILKINMIPENVSQEFWLKNIDEARNYLFEERKQNHLMSKKHKKVSTTLNYIAHLLTLASAVTGFVSISAFGSLVGIPIGSRTSVTIFVQ